jgi:hypothetical protein
VSLNKDPSSWAKVKPDAVIFGSAAQARNVIGMALQDIAQMAMEIERLKGGVRRTIAFYDSLERAHEPGEAELLDSLAAVLRLSDSRGKTK